MTDASRGHIVASAADVYDEFFVPALFAQWARPMIDAARVEPGHRVLDVGCGTGVVARAAAARVGPTGSVVGVDRNAAMLAVARRGSESVTWRRGAAESLPFEDASFDRVLCQFALMFFEDRRRSLAEIARVLVPDGRVAVATWAAVDQSPGYATMVELLHDLFGPAAANALLAPFRLGDASALANLIEPFFPDVAVTRHEGVARFASIDAWVRTDIRGWTLADMIDDANFARLLEVAHVALRPFTDPNGTVSFAAPALIATAIQPNP